ncbi:SMR family transporter [Helicobacter kayseriensis]|uniref:SMR family transporter n=1 Tax=Helicobacter kayseriensis TaxID=2905877 RepID=UPI001E3095E2|nr:SMR family transporter [Helicobacter kayseriensis]MCE3047658.1 SMR family transporter [Helicobacter kayseriensis]MCE3048990.1 SMR family transporter [Helicobacter kayseriensis]
MLYLYIIFSAFLDIIANILLGKSNGFANKKLGFLAIILVFFAFYILSLAITQGAHLSIAYASWGALGVLGTSLGGAIILKQNMNLIGWLGMLCIIASVILLNF